MRGDLAVLALTLGLASPLAAQDTVVVSPAGPFRSLGAAVRAAPAGSLIVVRAGIYREPTVLIDKPLRIVGDARPVFDGGGEREIVVVRADDVSVRGLVLRNVGASYTEDRSALRVVGARGCLLEGNRIENAFFGIYLAGVTDCRVSKNEIAGNARTEAGSGNGIHLWSSAQVRIDQNRIRGHRDGIYLEFTRHADVRSNVSERNLRYGLHFMYSDSSSYTGNVFRGNLAGVAVMYTKRIDMVDNTFEDSWGSASYGLLLKEVYDVWLERNRFRRNTVALLADGANRLHADRNEFAKNGWAVRLMASTQDGVFTSNSFLGNTFDVSTNSRQSYSGFRGNYWDTYRGYDLDRDGVGDVPHRPVRFFSLIVSENEPLMILLRSPFIDLLDRAERALPSLTPAMLSDPTPAMRRIP